MKCRDCYILVVFYQQLSINDLSDLSFAGNSILFKGQKYDYTKRGLSANAIVSSTLLSLATKGSTYSGEIHV